MTAGGGGGGVLVAAAALLLAGCVGSEVTQIGPRRPGRARNCKVQTFPSTRPPYPFSEVASARAQCHYAMGRGACIDELREQACAAGADTVFGFSEGMSGEMTFISATFAVRTADAPPVVARGGQPAAAAATPHDSATCTPICSPGFACQQGTCIPQCNPACEAGEVCNRTRQCQPALVGKAEPAGT
jgi:hypothetical protein